VEHTFNGTTSNWSFKSFIPLSDLFDPTKGYLVNDTLIVEAVVRDFLDDWSYDSKEKKGYAGNMMCKNSICEKLEDAMKGTTAEGTIKMLFEGVMSYIRCLSVNYNSTGKEFFYGTNIFLAYTMLKDMVYRMQTKVSCFFASHLFFNCI
ncbi:unnamed protein product, partial [Linum tenue]